MVAVAIAVFASACAKTSSASGSASTSTAAADTAMQAITADSLLQHIRDLSDDSTEGRAPGTPGEQKAIAYMQNQFKAMGLKPGNPDGTYLQNVDLMGYKAHPSASFSARGKNDRPQVSRRLHRQLAPQPSGDQDRGLRHRVRRIRRRRAGVRLG
jgi:hypothetical protein